MTTKAEAFKARAERSKPNMKKAAVKPRRDVGVDTALPGVSATDRKSGGRERCAIQRQLRRQRRRQAAHSPRPVDLHAPGERQRPPQGAPWEAMRRAPRVVASALAQTPRQGKRTKPDATQAPDGPKRKSSGKRKAKQRSNAR